MEEYKRNRKSISIGIILIILGVVFMLKNFEIIPYYFTEKFFNWKTLLMTIGVVFLINDHRKLTGAILISIGGFFLIPDFFHFPFNFHQIFWPAIFIIIGIYIVFVRRGHQNFFREKTDYQDDDYLDGTAIFSGSKKKITSLDFKGGNITTIFGGYDIDLTNAELSEGLNVLDVVILFGGLKLMVPVDWKIDVKATLIAGGIHDKRFSQSIEVLPGKVLVIEGVIMFGGCEIIGTFNRFNR